MVKIEPVVISDIGRKYKMWAYIDRLQKLPLVEARQEAEILLAKSRGFQVIVASDVDIPFEYDLGPTLVEFFQRYGRRKVRGVEIWPTLAADDGTIILAQTDEDWWLITLPNQDDVWETVSNNPACAAEAYQITNQFSSLYHWILKEWRAAELQAAIRGSTE